MKLAEDEQKIAEYYFRGPGDVSHMSVLTNRRLIVIYGNAEESYPLSKITAVKTIFNRSLWKILLGLCLALTGILTFPVGVLALAIGGWLVYVNWMGESRLVITQMGGEKYYVVRGRDPELTKFMDAINSKLT